jgi:hypothetical protein
MKKEPKREKEDVGYNEKDEKWEVNKGERGEKKKQNGRLQLRR